MMFFLFFDLKVGGCSPCFFEELPVRVVAASCLEDLLSREDQEAMGVPGIHEKSSPRGFFLMVSYQSMLIQPSFNGKSQRFLGTRFFSKPTISMGIATDTILP